MIASNECLTCVITRILPILQLDCKVFIFVIRVYCTAYIVRCTLYAGPLTWLMVDQANI